MKRILILFLIFFSIPGQLSAQNIPNGFVEIREVIPDIILDLRYLTNHNFLGVTVDGYKSEKCYITQAAADSLLKVQKEINRFGFTLKVYDAYRPQKAVDHFVRWAKDLADTITKKEFYPTIDKSKLFIDGFIAEKSVHSRGSTIDLTIVPLPIPSQPEFELNNQCEFYKSKDERFRDNSIDMGTGFDCFNELSHTENPNLSDQQRSNRLLLVSLMERYGFKNLPEEWWHFTLKNEPFPKTYFNFDIE